MRQFVTKTQDLHGLVVLAMFVSAPLLGSCHASDDDSESPKPQCVIQALETIAANNPTESVEIDVKFTSPQRRSDVSGMLAGLDLQPFALDVVRGDDSVSILGHFGSIEHAIDAAQTGEVAPLKPCWSESRFAVDENNCELRITRLKLRGPANTALAFRGAAGSIAITSRIPSEDEIIHLIQEQIRQSNDASTEALEGRAKQQLQAVH